MIRTVAELKQRAKAGDLDALHQLRASGFFHSRTGYPLSAAQRRLWVLDQMDDGSAAYNIPGGLLLEGTLDVAALRHALLALITHHESLRTRFVYDSGAPRQLLEEQPTLAFEVVDLSGEPEPHESARAHAQREAATPFELSQGPLLRTVLLCLAPDQHLFLFTLHHIIADGWSLGVLARELMALYAAHTRGEENPLPPLAIQYKDFAIWQNALLAGGESEEARTYWHRTLAGELPPLELPADFPRPPVKRYGGASHTLLLEPALTSALLALAQREQVSLYTLLVAAVKVLLYRYTGQGDLCIGTPIAGRTDAALDEQIGFYVNTLVLRDEAAGDLPFRRFLAQVHQSATEAYEHQLYPFDRLVTELDASRDPSRNPLFDVAVVLQDAAAADFTLPGVRVTPFPPDYEVSKFDLQFTFEVQAERLRLDLTYSTDLFLAERMARLAGHFQELVAGIVAEPATPLDDLPLLPAAERAQVLAFNRAAPAAPVTETLVSRFAQQVARTPEAVAVSYEGASLSYAALNTRANQLAHHLQTLGVGPETLVGLCLERSLDLVVGLLGILKAGGAYLPLDPTYPAERLAFMVADAEVPVVVTQTRLWEPLGIAGAAGPQLVCLDGDGAILAQAPTDSAEAEVAPENLAYVIYTSGSTGRPKGVQVSHANVVRLFDATEAWFGFNERDVWTLFHSYAFDFSVWELWGALLYGGRLVVVPYLVSRAPELFRALLAQEGVTVLNQTPSAFRQLSEADQQASAPLVLRTIIFGGEALEVQSLRRWFERHGDEQPRLVNMYGITETTVHVTYRPLGWADLRHPASVIGQAIPDLSLYILDEQLRPLPIGITGEMYVGGAGVARGYLNRPDLTRERFLPDPFSADPMARLYKTGDLARYLPNGDIEYLGRRDQQVKIRGFRIELGEIEAALVAHPDVTQALVLAQDEASGGRLLVAYLTGAASLTAADLRRYLAARLPEYMVPGQFIRLEQFPLTENGKVDRRALVATGVARLHTGAAYVAPRTELESRLTHLWAEVLEVEQVGLDDSFFDLGGHSLKGILLLSRLHAEMGIKVGLRDLFAAPTIAALAAQVEATAPTPFLALHPAPAAEHYPLSHAQRRLWVIERMGASLTAYNLPTIFELVGDLDLPALEEALNHVVARHESLRTTFIRVGEEPRQVVQPIVPFPLAVVDLRGISEPEAEARRRAQEEARYPFDLLRGPLFRALLLRLEENRAFFLLTMHHIISDGWSGELLIKELVALYQARQAGQPLALPPLPLQYKDYAAWQHALPADVLAPHRDYWLHRFAGEVPILDLPTDFPRPAVQNFEGRLAWSRLPAPDAEALRALGQRHGATPFMTLLALVKTLLHRYTGQEEIVVGSTVAGREHAALTGQVGFFVNMLALRDSVRGEASFVHLLQGVRATVTEATEHQSYPFDRLVEELTLRRDMGRSPLFDVAITMPAEAQRSDALTTLAVTPVEVEMGTSKFDLTFFFLPLADGSYDLGIEYSTALFLPERIERMADHLRALARSILAAPTAPLRELTLLPVWERERVVRAWNQTQTLYPHEATIAACFEQQAEATPERVAVLFGERALTYRELNERSNRVAHWLRDVAHLEPEARVGVLLDRSEWTAVALLAILKAGGAYLPLDPAYPRQRLEYILTDADCRLVLSEPRHLDGLLAGVAGAVDLHTLPPLSGENPPPIGDGGTLAYVIYTSGSTGQPKGSLIEQRSVLRLVLNSNYISIQPTDRLLQTGSLAFDASTFEVWGALLNGATLCFPDEGILLEAERLGRLVARQGITILFLTTSLFNQFVEAQPEMFAGLRVVLTGGEKVSVRHINRVRERYPALSLLHVYGPTENTTFSTFYPVTQRCTDDVPIGYPLANSTVYILDDAQRPVPIGVPGELCTGGDGVARGYLNRPDLTQEKFVPDPFAAGGRLYRTGDLALWLPDGAVRFIGRIDNQLKVRGFRIEPGEIEHRLLMHPAMKEAVVIARDTTVGTKELIAYFVAERALGAGELRGHLLEALPEYMVPAYFVPMERLPLKTMGKVDRAALPDPEAGTLAEGEAYKAPRSEAEALLAAVWQEVLGRERVSIHENYFDLGGDSIRAIQISSRLARQGWKMAMQDLFQEPTIAALGLRLTRAEAESAEQGTVSGPVPLTPIQQWFFAEHEGDLAHFNQALLLRPTEQLDERALSDVLTALPMHHDALRMQYVREEGQVKQHLPADPPPLAFEVLEGVSAEEMTAHIEQAHRGLDLTTGPLWRSVLYRLPEGERLLLVVHHLVVDGVSWRVLLEDLERGYRQVVAGEVLDFGSKQTSFKRWAEALVAYSRAGALLALPYWQESEAQEGPPMPGVRGGMHRYGESQSVGFSLSEPETQALLTETHHAYTTQMNDLLLTALGRALRRWHGGSVTRLLLEGHGREPLAEGLDLSRTVGWFTSLYPFVLAVEGEEIGEQIKAVKERLRRVPERGMPYGVLRYLTPAAQRDGLPLGSLPPITFNYLGQFDEGGETGLFRFAEEESGPPISPTLRRAHELDIVGLVGGGRLSFSLTFNPDWQPAEAMARLCDDFRAELLAVLDHCLHRGESEKTLSDFTYGDLSAEDYARILEKLS